jgi:hypothetical protein
MPRSHFYQVIEIGDGQLYIIQLLAEILTCQPKESHEGLGLKKQSKRSYANAKNSFVIATL